VRADTLSESRLSPSVYAGVFLLTASGLWLEVGLTRIFSATIWYHFAFVAVSAALLGWGLGGFAVHLSRGRLRSSPRLAGVLSLLYAVSIPAALFFMVRFPFERERLASYFAASVVPFLLAGMALSVVFDVHRERSGRVYFADLLGASAGALLATPLLSWLGGEAAVVAAALAPAAAAACLWTRLIPVSLAAGMAVIAIIGTAAGRDAIAIRGASSKAMYRDLAAAPGSRISLTGWNAYSRIDAVTGLGADPLARLYIDADAWTNVHRWDGNVETLRGLCGWYRALPYRLARPRVTLIIGPGGGYDVLTALGCGSERVVTAELNPLMLRFVRHFGPAAGDLYDHAQVEAHLAEGRHFLERSDRRFDTILLGFVDSWASVASGGLSLSENYLYTVEAFESYLESLTDDGMLVIQRWDVDVPRLVANAVVLLGPAAAEHVAVVSQSEGIGQDPPQMTFMLKRRPFSEAEAAQIAENGARARLVIAPRRFAEPPYDALLSGRKSLEQYAADSAERTDPVFDDSPFFFARQKPWGVPRVMVDGFRTILAPVLGLCALLALLGKPKGARAGPYVRSLAYFGSLGLGFIAVELALLQQLTLLLGHPIYTLSLLLASLLAAGGAGSYASARTSLRAACLAAAGLALVYAFALPRSLPSLLGLPLVARAAIAVALIAPLGFVMGIPFPGGLRSTGRGSLPAPPFYWGLNGVFSVIGSIGTMLLAVSLGFRAVMAAGSVCYLIACAAVAGVGGDSAEASTSPPR
jgi:predicted membrane-bound spermidine synthase